MGIEEQIDRLIDAGDDILKALETLNERVAEIVERFGGDVKAEPVEPEPAKPKRWRYRQEHEIVQPGDWANSVRHALGSWPPASGWVDAESCIGMRVGEVIDKIRIACEVIDDANQSDQSPDAGEKVAEEPVEEPEPEYEEPILPRDAGKQCEFSKDGKNWFKGQLVGWRDAATPWVSDKSFKYIMCRHARIRKDA